MSARGVLVGNISQGMVMVDMGVLQKNAVETLGSKKRHIYCRME